MTTPKSAFCRLFLLVFLSFVSLGARGQLSVSFGAGGLQQISYAGVLLEDTNSNSGDAFHIWHMKVTDLQGNVQTGPMDGWGENSASKTWDANAHAWTYQFPWGSIQMQYVQAGDTLNMVVTEVNRANSGEILDGASIYPLALHFPALPSGFINASYPQIAFNTTGPSALLADFGAGEVASVVPDATKPLYSGFWPSSGSSPVYSTMISSTTPDGLATFQPHNDRPVAPGQTDTFTVSPSVRTIRHTPYLACDRCLRELGRHVAPTASVDRQANHRHGLPRQLSDRSRCDSAERIPE